MQRLAWVLTAINLAVLLGLGIAALLIVGKIRAIENPSSFSSEGQSGEALLQVFPELRFDGMLSDGCVSDMRAYARRTDDSSERRRLLQRIDVWRSHPYSMMSRDMLYQMSSLIDALAHSRGWYDWNSEYGEYQRYERSYDVSDVGASSPLPCIEERKRMSTFVELRYSNPMGEFRGRILDTHWECANRITSREYDERNERACRTFNDRYSQWLPLLPESDGSHSPNGSGGMPGSTPYAPTATPTPTYR